MVPQPLPETFAAHPCQPTPNPGVRSGRIRRLPVPLAPRVTSPTHWYLPGGRTVSAPPYFGLPLKTTLLPARLGTPSEPRWTPPTRCNGAPKGLKSMGHPMCPLCHPRAPRAPSWCSSAPCQLPLESKHRFSPLQPPMRPPGHLKSPTRVQHGAPGTAQDPLARTRAGAVSHVSRGRA